jgi:hypothetical protein
MVAMRCSDLILLALPFITVIVFAVLVIMAG